ncbi:MAG: type II toxin-antitoxin system mRNA interferase toxin, RelE/StbE family [Leptolyngbyaceae cyanobacterium CSU_1_3]|nr:type II toxin-antitoxin system mRNA interferase toxin, RelE/StbE family [Leptolyngbyaceae cyanobacterium CSU_1_3]
MSDEGWVRVEFTAPFKRNLKELVKRYRQVQADILPVIEQLQQGNFIGDQITGTDYTVLKVRAKNSDVRKGKSGGYRLIYQVVSPETVLLLLIYSKSDRPDVAMKVIQDAISEALEAE